MNELMIFEGHEVEILELNEQVLFNPYHVGECLNMAPGTVKDHMSKMNKKQVIKLKNSDVGLTNFRRLNNAGENFLTERGVYKLVLKSRKPNAEAFSDWITDEVLPTIRKTGGYVNNDDIFINTYLPFADDTTKSLFKTTLTTVRKQNEVIAAQNKQIESQKQEIKEKQETINHKENVIQGLTDGITLAEMRQVLNKVLNHNTSKFQERWGALYKEFELKYHCSIKRRMESYNKKINQSVKLKLN